MFLRDILSPQIDQNCLFLRLRTGHDPNLGVDFWGLRFSYAAATFLCDSISYGALWKCQICRYFWYTHFWPPSIIKEIVRVFDTFWSPTWGGTSGVSLRTSKLMVDFSGVAVFCHFWKCQISRYFLWQFFGYFWYTHFWPVIFCDYFLVIFDTPIFGQLFFVTIFWLFLIHPFLGFFVTIFWLFLIHPFLTSFHYYRNSTYFGHFWAGCRSARALRGVTTLPS